jgi:DNA-binding Lrp family transcriptional regulator
MWCLDKITKIEKDVGYVLGGKPINLSDLAEQFKVTDATVSRNLQRLEEEGYLKRRHTPYGIVLIVLKAKKRFNKNVEPPYKNVKPPYENVEPNKTVSIDKTIDTSGVAAGEIVLLIDSFKEINPSFGKWYGNKTQRAAANRLIETHGLDQLLKIVKILPKTNTMQYVPTITTIVELEDKYAKLKATLEKKKEESLKTKSTVAF